MKRFLYGIDNVMIRLEDWLPPILRWPIAFLVLTLICLPCSIFLAKDDLDEYLGRYE